LAILNYRTIVETGMAFNYFLLKSWKLSDCILCPWSKVIPDLKKSIFGLRFCLKMGYDKYQVLVSSWALADMVPILMQKERNEKVPSTTSIDRAIVETGNGIYSFLVKSWVLADLVLCEVKWQIKILNLHHYCDRASAETGKAIIKSSYRREHLLSWTSYSWNKKDMNRFRRQSQLDLRRKREWRLFIAYLSRYALADWVLCQWR
jgi:hypothetical protein